MRKAGLDEAQTGIKIARRNINNFRYADDTTLMAESEEELKSLLMKVKEENEQVGLKLDNQKTKIIASGPITSWQTDGETVTDLIWGRSKITADGDCSHEIKRHLLLGRKFMTNLEGDNRGWDGWMASPTQWIWVWENSRTWWWTGKPGMLQSMGLQRVEHNWVTERLPTKMLLVSIQRKQRTLLMQ